MYTLSLLCIHGNMMYSRWSKYGVAKALRHQKLCFYGAPILGPILERGYDMHHVTGCITICILAQ
jgi:hypothetical protein